MAPLSPAHLNLFAATLWAIAVNLLLVHTFLSPDHGIDTWALMVGLAATVVTLSSTIRRATERERLRTEYIAELVADKMRDEQGVRRIR